MSLSSVGGYNAYAQQYAANNTPTQTEIAKAMMHEVRSQIANGTIADVGELGDSVSISDGARRALAALLALQKEPQEEDISNPDTLAELITPKQTDVNDKRADAVIRSLYR